MQLLTQLAKLERRFLEIENALSLPENTSNSRVFKQLSKERAEKHKAVDLYYALKKVLNNIEETSLLMDESQGEMKDLAFEEIKILEKEKQELLAEISIELLPKDANDSRNIILEIRAGAGGDEASLFAAQMYRAYARYCEQMRWKFELLSISENELGGFKEVIASVEGDFVYRWFKYESGVHRVQRVPSTETQGRVHTSTVTVAVMPEAEDIEVSINENDLRIDTYRAGGAGGQHVNRTDSAVRITHMPSGIVVACQDERSQIKNRSKAMKILQSRLLEAAQIEHEKTLSADRKAQVGRGDRSERIRTYNFPQSRITDHRIGFTTHAIEEFMQGHVQEMFEKLQEFYKTEMLKAQNLEA
jgi:peptide chain release factor 1